MTEDQEKKILVATPELEEQTIIALIKDLDLRLLHVEKLLSKTDVKEAWELQIELDRIKKILIEKTVSGNEKPSKYSKSILDKIKKF